MGELKLFWWSDKEVTYIYTQELQLPSLRLRWCMAISSLCSPHSPKLFTHLQPLPSNWFWSVNPFNINFYSCFFYVCYCSFLCFNLFSSSGWVYIFLSRLFIPDILWQNLSFSFFIRGENKLFQLRQKQSAACSKLWGLWETHAS